MLFDARRRPAYSQARVNRALVSNGRIGTRTHNEYPYRRYEQQNQGFMTGLESYSVQTIYVTVVNVLGTKHTFACISAVIYFIFALF